MSDTERKPIVKDDPLSEPTLSDAEEPQNGVSSTRPKPRSGLLSRLLDWPRSLLTVLSFAIFAGLWWLCSAFLFNPRILPPPTKVALGAWELLIAGDLLEDIAASLRRVAVGLVLGTLLGTAIGLAIGRTRVAALLVDPVLQLMRNLSPTAMIPIALIWFGIGESAKYFLIFWGTFFIVAVNTTAGVHSTPLTRIRAAQCMGASEARIFLAIVLPSSLPYLFAGIRLAVASGFMTIVPAEILAARDGLGAQLQQASIMGQMDVMFVALAVIAILGFSTDRGVRYLSEKTFARYTGYLSRL